jgi:phosphoribosylamine--glycine ligase
MSPAILLLLLLPQAKLLEHNVRFGDPECQGLMARLDSDLLEVLMQVTGGRKWGGMGW